MTFEEWWKDLDKDYSVYAIPDEIKWFAERAWNQAVNETIKQEEKLTKWKELEARRRLEDT